MSKAAVLGISKDGFHSVQAQCLEHLAQSKIEGFVINPSMPLEVIKDFDCLVVCGTLAIHPEITGKKSTVQKEYSDKDFDKFVIKIIKEYISIKKPILAICRGMLLVNIALGGTIVQDTWAELKLCHIFQNNNMHEIKFAKSSRLFRSFGTSAVVNSVHSQSVYIIGKNLNVTAACHDGITEALEGDKLPILAVQWCPEKMSGNAVFDLFANEFIKKSAYD